MHASITSYGSTLPKSPQTAAQFIRRTIEDSPATPTGHVLAKQKHRATTRPQNLISVKSLPPQVVRLHKHALPNPEILQL